MSKDDLIRLIQVDMDYIIHELDKYQDIKSKDKLYDIRQKVHELKMVLQ